LGDKRILGARVEGTAAARHKEKGGEKKERSGISRGGKGKNKGRRSSPDSSRVLRTSPEVPSGGAVNCEVRRGEGEKGAYKPERVGEMFERETETKGGEGDTFRESRKGPRPGKLGVDGGRVAPVPSLTTGKRRGRGRAELGGKGGRASGKSVGERRD